MTTAKPVRRAYKFTDPTPRPWEFLYIARRFFSSVLHESFDFTLNQRRAFRKAKKKWYNIYIYNNMIVCVPGKRCNNSSTDRAKRRNPRDYINNNDIISIKYNIRGVYAYLRGREGNVPCRAAATTLFFLFSEFFFFFCRVKDII